ncbi:low molecular weight protein-tyrosine-phosphatase [Silvanigrella sp.]|jgi:protein-tyrosine phosphatase|uniref:low molecular weight protein-tyrosine-phosphatase n=1 Tax=Silvanigrella sp. TaxID=2024976 RepID=UPI0037C69603
MNKINSVLLVCIGNICRSPYAEIKLKEILKNSKLDNFNISSAGIYAMIGEPANLNSIKVANEKNLDLSGHIAKQLTIDHVKLYELILVMEEDQKKWIEKKYPFSFGKVHLIGKWNNEIMIFPQFYRHN